MKKLIVCVAIGAMFGIGCNRNSGETGGDPLAVLGSPQAATNYDYPFWNDQFQRKTDAWKKALSFCNQPDHKLLVNCQPVLAVAENSGASSWLQKGTPIPFGLVPKPTKRSDTR